MAAHSSKSGCHVYTSRFVAWEAVTVKYPQDCGTIGFGLDRGNVPSVMFAQTTSPTGIG
jgi:hypothetical protein